MSRYASREATSAGQAAVWSRRHQNALIRRMCLCRVQAHSRELHGSVEQHGMAWQSIRTPLLAAILAFLAHAAAWPLIACWPTDPYASLISSLTQQFEGSTLLRRKCRPTRWSVKSRAG